MKRYTAFSAFMLTLLVSCVVVPKVPQYTGANPYYSGSGEGHTFLEALNQAKLNTLQLAVIDLIGATEEMQSRNKLHRFFMPRVNRMRILKPTICAFYGAEKTTAVTIAKLPYR